MDKIERKVLASRYGFALAFMNSDPELRKLFNHAVKQTWTTDMFIARLRNTKWFKTHSANVRNAILQETADPATYQANVAQMESTVRDTWGSMFGKGYAPPKDLKVWAETAFRMGWSESQLMDHLTKGLNYSKMLRQNSLGGKAAEVEGQLNALTQNYGVDLGRHWKAAQLEKLMGGDDTIAGVQQRVREMAMREYSAFKDQIAAGSTVAEIADPYRQKMAGLLELNPNDIGIQDRKIQGALKRTDAKGRPAALSLTAFEDEVRKDRRWQYTDNAREQVNSVTAGLLRNFGLVS